MVMAHPKIQGFFFTSLSIALFLLFSGVCSPSEGGSEPWKKLLKAHVDAKGFLDYEGVRKDRELLDRSLERLKKGAPGSDASEEERIAYWINAYNAFTIQLILEHYPVESINDIDRAFERKFISIDGKKYSLDGIEKGILLEEFDDPRIHYAVNCASVSCPPLRNEPYRAEELDRQLEDQARRFVNDSDKNLLKEDRVRISKLYDWYRKDFERNGSLIEHLNRYAEGVTIAPDARIEFMEYDWGLNESS